MKKKKILKAVLRTALLALVGIVIGVTVYNFNSKRVAGDKMPMPLGFNVSVVLSGSMEPELSVNDLIVVKKTEKLYTGQVVVYQNKNSLVVHRIKEIDGDTVITQGDANNTPDDPVKRSDIKGEVVLAVPYVGLAMDIIKNPIVTLVLVGAALWLTERSFRNEKKSEQSSLEALQNELDELKEELKK